MNKAKEEFPDTKIDEKLIAKDSKRFFRGIIRTSEKLIKIKTEKSDKNEGKRSSDSNLKLSIK